MITDPELLESLKEFNFNDDGVEFGFADRLARENGWNARFTQRVLEEYRRFLYLSQVTQHPVTPSEEVDRAWHLHLCYTRSYWIDLCGGVLQAEFHHGPTKGGNSEAEKFRDWYEETIKSYEREFGHAPPADIWPSIEDRFRRNRTQWVDRSRYWVVSKPAAAMSLGAVLTAAVSMGCSRFFSDMDADTLSMWIVGGFLLGLITLVCVIVKIGGGRGGGNGGGGMWGGCGGCSGCGGCGS